MPPKTKKSTRPTTRNRPKPAAKDEQRKRTAIYARVSTRDQNPDMQIHELHAYVKARGFSITHEFVDRESGTKESRPELDKLWQVVRARDVDVVLVWKFDRFSRSTKQLINALSEFEAIGVDFISKTDQIDTTSPAGRALFTMISAFAQFERDIISERVKSGIDRARAQGKRLGRPPRPDEQKQKIQKLRQQGLSYTQIATQTAIPRSTVSIILGKKEKKK